MTITDILEENTLYSFYGVDCNQFKLGNIVFEAIEDRDDGYRSYLDSIPIINSSSIFSGLPIINVYFRESKIDYYYLAGIELYDESGHIWLSVGTNHEDSYYPEFVFSYTPRTDIQEYSVEIGNLDDFDPLSLHPEKLI